MEFKQNKWSEEDKKLLTSLCNKGLTAREIYEGYNGLLQRSLKSIENQIHSLRGSGKITSPKKRSHWTEVQDSLLIQLTDSGMSVPEIYAKFNGEFEGRTLYSLYSRLTKLRNSELIEEEIEEIKEPIEEPLFDDEKITNGQQKAINIICNKLGIEFTGETKNDAQKFISENKAKSYAVKQGNWNDAFTERVDEVSHQNVDELIKKISENTETMSKGFDAMIRGIVEIKALLVEINSNSRDIVKADKDIQEKMQTIQKFGVTVKGMK